MGKLPTYGRVTVGQREDADVLQDLTRGAPTSLNAPILCCTVAPTSDGELTKVQVIADAQVRPVALAIGQALVAQRGETKFAPPPKTSAERAVASALPAIRRT
mmetsp:Transcript_41841/g.135382  ORF Transcript_41841/g.135382 Transcript_41841/m.135382 type:complete len:103 (-) Transcript_41841:67-375(-)